MEIPRTNSKEPNKNQEPTQKNQTGKKRTRTNQKEQKNVTYSFTFADDGTENLDEFPGFGRKLVAFDLDVGLCAGIAELQPISGFLGFPARDLHAHEEVLFSSPSFASM